MRAMSRVPMRFALLLAAAVIGLGVGVPGTAAGFELQRPAADVSATHPDAAHTPYQAAWGVVNGETQTVVGRAATAMPAWQQTNANGFGTTNADEVSALAAFGSDLYAGTSNPTDGARIFRSADGATWTPVTEPGFGIAHDIAPPAILDMFVFGGRLYASTGRGDGPAQIWRTLDGVNWAPMVITGFSDPDTVDVTAMAEFNGMIYAGAANLITGAQIWRSFTGDNNSWTQVAPAAPGTEVARITGMAEFDGALYAAVDSAGPVQLWQSFGSDWTTVVDDGFGDSNTKASGGMAAFNGYLYVGAGNNVTGAQLWRTNDDVTWDQVITPGFGNPNNQQVDQVFVFENALYVSVRNPSAGLAIWRSSNGTAWEQVAPAGFGDSDNTGTNWSNATADYGQTLYVGTVNAATGGELWRMQRPYAVTLSAGAAQSGAAGTTVTYSVGITNTGTTTDTFDLAATGNSWDVTLSTHQLTLAPAAGAHFTVEVTIPENAADLDHDTVTVSATSQGDTTVTATSTLTTTCVAPPTYGVDLSPDQSGSGAPGRPVIYALTITNTGTMTDTFDLLASGQRWPTSLSPAVVSLAPAASTTFTVTVDIPPAALDQATDVASAHATSHGDSLKVDAATLTTTSLRPAVHGVALSPDQDGSGAPGQTVTYTVALTNTGNITDSFQLAAGGQTWTTTLSAAEVVLGPAQSTTFTVRVTIPQDAANAATDHVTVAATAQSDSGATDAAVLTTTAVDLPAYGVDISAAQSASGTAGGQIDYSVTVTNTSTVVDTVDLTLDGNQWPTELATQSAELAGGAGQVVVVTVSIPASAHAGDRDQATIVATSRSNPDTRDSTVLTTFADVARDNVYLPLVMAANSH